MKKTVAVVLACMLACVCITGCSDIPYDTPGSSAVSQEETTTTSRTTTSATATTTMTTTTTTTTTVATTTTTTTAAKRNNVEAMVWIPQSGKKYHNKASCSNMKGPRQVSISEAINSGYEPCKRCYK